MELTCARRRGTTLNIVLAVDQVSQSLADNGMVVGDKYLFWIPEELAYKGTPNRPQGMLVFEIELLSIPK